MMKILCNDKLHNCSVRQISCYYGSLVKENEFGGAYVTHGTDEKDMQIMVQTYGNKIKGENV